MKPRLTRAPLTDEDMWIRKRIAWRIAPSILGAADYRYALTAADRRDAELMYLARLWRDGQMVVDHTYAYHGPRGRFAIDAKRCGGDL